METKGYFELEMSTLDMEEGLLVKKERENLKIRNPSYY
jgi:hypothetical protein